MKSKPIFVALLAAGLALLAALPMADVLVEPDTVLAFNDGSVESSLSPIYHFPGVLLRSWDNQFFFGNGCRQYWLSMYALCETLFGSHEGRRSGVVLVLAVCGLALYWALRQFRVRPAAAAFAAGATMLSGVSFSFAVAGLYVRPTAVACAALALGFAERARERNGWLGYIIAGGCTGLAVSEVPDVGAFLALAVAAFVAVRHIAAFGWSLPALTRLALRGALLGATALLLAWQTVVNMAATNIQGVTQGQGQSKSERYAWATQWSIPPVETWDIVAGTYFGTSMSDPELPYRGGIGSTEGWKQSRQGMRNFRMSAWYAGVIPSILLLALIPYAWRKRADESALGNDAPPCADRGLVRLVLIGALVALVLSWGRYFPAYRLVWSLPYFSTIRNPDKLNAVFMLFMTLGVAFSADGLLRTLTAAPAASGKTARRESPLRPYLVAAGALAGIALLTLLAVGMDRTGFVGRLRAEGYGTAGAALWSHALWTSLKVLAIAAGFGGLIWWGARRPRMLVAVAAVVALITAADLCASGRHFATPHRYKGLVAPNALLSFLDAHAREGRVLVLPPGGNPRDPSGGQAAALAQALNQMRMTMLQVKGYDLFNPISVSRMPTDYESFFEIVGYMTPRMLELGNVRWIVTVAGMREALDQMDGGRGRFVERLALGLSMRDGGVVPVDEGGPEQRVLRVVEFTGALPKFQPVARGEPAPAGGAEAERTVLQQLARADFDPRQVAVVHGAGQALAPEGDAAARVEILEETSSETKIRVQAQRPTLLVRATKFDADWVAHGAGEPQAPLRVNYLFQGYQVPAGDHTLTLRYEPALGGLAVAIVGRALLFVLIAWSLFMGARRPAVAV